MDNDNNQMFIAEVKRVFGGLFKEHGYVVKSYVKRGRVNFEKIIGDNRIIITFWSFFTTDICSFFIAIDGKHHVTIENTYCKFPEQWRFNSDHELSMRLNEAKELFEKNELIMKNEFQMTSK